MRFCTFEIRTPLGRHRRLGVVSGDEVIDLHSACVWHLARKGESQPYRIATALLPPEMLRFLQGEETSMATAAGVIADLDEYRMTNPAPYGPNEETIFFAAKEVRLIAPLPRPASMRDFYAFEAHVKKGFEKRGEPMPAEWYEMPVYYKGNAATIIGPEETVVWPSFTEKFDYELELAVIIGRSGMNISETAARGYIAGFTVMNDFSARDMQRKEMKVRLGPAKGKDFATAIGPVMVTPDEIGNPYDLAMTARVNGETWSSGNSGSIFHSFEKMIAFASMGEPLQPGDLIGSGTVGTGCGLELDRWVKPGDVIELEIEKIGILRNTVAPRTSAVPPGKSAA
jgi:2-keto-4-pentenoate hydratase/2-oxohepta-3-ene-1,7-dioic acid hydratase in catechol pathway